MDSAPVESKVHWSRWRFATAVAIAILVVASCANTERQGLRVARTATIEPGVRLIVDNCPGPEEIVFSVRDEVLWSVENPNAAAEAEAASEARQAAADATTTTADSIDPSATTVDPATPGPLQPPGLLDVLIGTPPPGWTTTQELGQPLREDIRYTIRTEPDGQTIEFATPNLSTGALFDGETGSPFQSASLAEPCEEPADVGEFFKNLAVLGALGITSAAFVLVSLITLLFAITRRFSRIRTIEKRAAAAMAADHQNRGE